jgi:hypothetical protein
MKPMCAELFRKYPKLGRFSMRDLSRVVGVGVITQITDYETVKGGKNEAVEVENEAGKQEPEIKVEVPTPDPPKSQEKRVQMKMQRNAAFI